MPILLQYQSCRIENAYIMQYNEHEVTMMPGNTNMSVIDSERADLLAAKAEREQGCIGRTAEDVLADMSAIIEMAAQNGHRGHDCQKHE